MSVIINEQTRAVVQGMTGREGKRATKNMIASGIPIICGVTPGKGGAQVEGIDLPVFDSVKEARDYDPSINTSVLYVPPLMVYDAALEAMHAGVSTIIVITENVPVKDSAKLVAYARFHNCKLVGPASVGVLNTRIGKLGSIDSGTETGVYTTGNVGIISKSGGMCNETASILTQAGIGQSTAVGIGGDVIAGTSFTDALAEFQNDKETEAVVIFGEIGGTYEEQVADMVQQGKFTKPLIAFISGSFAESIGRGLALGHAGAIIENGKGTAADKKKALKEAGVIVADFHDDIPMLVQQALGAKHAVQNSN